MNRHDPDCIVGRTGAISKLHNERTHLIFNTPRQRCWMHGAGGGAATGEPGSWDDVVSRHVRTNGAQNSHDNFSLHMQQKVVMGVSSVRQTVFSSGRSPAAQHQQWPAT